MKNCVYTVMNKEDYYMALGVIIDASTSFVGVPACRHTINRSTNEITLHDVSDPVRRNVLIKLRDTGLEGRVSIS